MADRGRTRSKSRGRGRSRSRSRGPKVTIQTTATAVEPKPILKNGGGKSPGRRRSKSRSGSRRRRSRGRGDALRPNRKKAPRRQRGRVDVKIKGEIKRLKRKVDGPKVSNTFTATSTLGIINGNTDRDRALLKQYTVFTHPCLNKNSESGEGETPLSARASDYALWRISHMGVIFMPLVQAAAVTNTLTIASLDQDGQAAKDENIDTIFAKKYYAECQLGARFQWDIPASEFEGPRETWWEVNTNNTAAATVGPVLSIHTWGTTYHLFVAGDVGSEKELKTYGGPLFSVQLRITYQFANWEPKPAMKVLETETFPTDNATIKTDDEGNLTLDVQQSPEQHTRKSLNRYMSHRERHIKGPKFRSHAVGAVNETNGIGSHIWALTDQAAEGVANLAGPWGWLLKGGYYFLRKVLGPSSANDETTTTFVVYPSMEDAQTHNPCQVDEPIPPQSLEVKEVKVVQMNAPNLATVGGDFNPAPGAAEYPVPKASKMPNPLTKNDGTLQPLAEPDTGNDMFMIAGNPRNATDVMSYGVGMRGAIAFHPPNQSSPYPGSIGMQSFVDYDGNHIATSWCIWDLHIPEWDRQPEPAAFVPTSADLPSTILGDTNALCNTLVDPDLNPRQWGAYWKVERYSMTSSYAPNLDQLGLKPITDINTYVCQYWGQTAIQMARLGADAGIARYNQVFGMGQLMLHVIQVGRNTSWRNKVIFCVPDGTWTGGQTTLYTMAAWNQNGWANWRAGEIEGNPMIADTSGNPNRWLVPSATRDEVDHRRRLQEKERKIERLRRQLEQLHAGDDDEDSDTDSFSVIGNSDSKL